ncbi:O-antigen ligase family protein [Anaerofustis butyriciformans]|uniref:O-antigen ligase family protein n=1 Tax=Anaerofustis butyriciformans TaxID=3108533 RepID=UPI003F8BD4A2
MSNLLINVINKISNWNQRVSNENKAKILIFSFFLLFVNMMLSTSGVYKGSTSIAAFIGVLITFVIICLSTPKIDKIEFNKTVMILYYIVGICFLMSAILHKVVAFILLALILLFLFPIFYIIFNAKKDYNEFLVLFSKGAKYSYILMIIISIIISPLSDGQYASFLANPNGLGAFVSVMFASLLYLYEIQEDKKDKIINMILIGSIFAFAIFTKSRTTYLCLGFSFMVYLIYLFINKRYTLKNIIMRILKIIVSAVLGTVIMFVCLTYVNGFILKTEENIFGSSFKVVFDPQSSYNEITSLNNQLVGAAERGKKGIGNSDSLSSGRAEIWKTYLNDLNITGHNADKLKVLYQGGYIEANAHNTYLQIAHSGGIIVGISFIILNIMFAYYLFRILFKGIKERYLDEKYLFLGGMLISCEITMVLSSVYYPYISSVSLFYYFIIGYLFNKKKYLDI